MSYFVARNGAVGVAVVTALFLFVACGAAFAQEPLKLFGLTIPDRVAGLPHGKPFDHEKTQPGGGYSVQFIHSYWVIDVYIYDLGMKSIPDDPMSPIMKNQRADTRSAMTELERRGLYANVKEEGEYIINDTKGRTRFVCIKWAYLLKDKGPVDSHLCLTSVKNKFFKIRMTTQRNKASREEAMKFVEAWIPVLWPSR